MRRARRLSLWMLLCLWVVGGGWRVALDVGHHVGIHVGQGIGQVVELALRMSQALEKKEAGVTLLLPDGGSRQVELGTLVTVHQDRLVLQPGKAPNEHVLVRHGTQEKAYAPGTRLEVLASKASHTPDSESKVRLSARPAGHQVNEIGQSDVSQSFSLEEE